MSLVLRLLRTNAKFNICKDKTDVLQALKKRYKGNVVRAKYDFEIIHEKVRACPIKIRGAYKLLRAQTGISMGSLHCSMSRSDLSSEKNFNIPLTKKNLRMRKVNQSKMCSELAIQ